MPAKKAEAEKAVVKFRCEWCGTLLLDELRPDGTIASLSLCPCFDDVEEVDTVRGLWRRR